MLGDRVQDSIPAWTPGQMRLRPDHYPALFLQQHGVVGSTDYSQDLTLDTAPVCVGVGRVVGCLLTLSEGTQALPELDEFEGFFPQGVSEYLRVALSVHTERGLRPCWTYTGVGTPPTNWPLIEEWPPEQGVRVPEPYNHGLEGA